VTQIVSIHSFRGGTGKSNITANVAALLAGAGQRVAVVDTDIQSPGIHILFGLHGDQVGYTLNDYLWGDCEIEQAAVDTTANLETPVAGRVFLVPSSIKSGEIARILREGCDARRLTAGFRRLMRELDLDVLLIDTHPGLNEETLLSIALSHALIVVMRPDQQDYEGTGVTVEVAQALGVPHLMVVVNKLPAAFDAGAVAAQVSDTLGCPVAAVLPHSDAMMALASSGLFALRCPEDPVSAALRDVAARLAAGARSRV
jgi:MinD-like ATPase involved in chromosome partitioning or flagellar assembly